jgi:hypothetical protein
MQRNELSCVVELSIRDGAVWAAVICLKGVQQVRVRWGGGGGWGEGSGGGGVLVSVGRCKWCGLPSYVLRVPGRLGSEWMRVGGGGRE